MHVNQKLKVSHISKKNWCFYCRFFSIHSHLWFLIKWYFSPGSPHLYILKIIPLCTQTKNMEQKGHVVIWIIFEFQTRIQSFFYHVLYLHSALCVSPVFFITLWLSSSNVSSPMSPNNPNQFHWNWLCQTVKFECRL